MPTTETISTRETLLALFAEDDGDWMRTHTDLAKKVGVDIPTTKATAEKWAKTMEKDGYKVITILDSSYPASLESVFRPPYVMAYKGEMSVYEKAMTPFGKGKVSDFVFLEKSVESLSRVLDKNKILFGTYDEAQHTLWLHDSETGNDFFMVESRQSAWDRLSTACRKFVAVDGDPEFVKISETMYPEYEPLYALPGNSGCECNRLIKKGWHLCDQSSDLA